MEEHKEIISPLHHQDNESYGQQSVVDELNEQTKLEIDQINDDIKSQKLAGSPNKIKIQYSVLVKRLDEVEGRFLKLENDLKDQIEKLSHQLNSIEEKPNPAKPNLTQNRRADQQLLDKIKILTERTDALDLETQHLNDRYSSMELRFVHQDQILREIGSSGSSLKETLQELIDIKLEAPSIIEGLKLLVSKHIEKEYMQPMLSKVEEIQKETLQLSERQQVDNVKCVKVALAQKEQIESLAREIKEFGVRFQNELANYLTVAAYDQAAQENILAQQEYLDSISDSLVSKQMFEQLVEQCQTFSSRETASELAKQIAELRKLAKEKLAYITDLENKDEKIRSWCEKTFCTMTEFESQQETVELQIGTMKKLSNNLDLSLREITQSFNSFNVSIQRTVGDNMTRTTKSLQELQTTIKRLALYEDLQDLYKKFMPALKLLQDQFEIMSDGHKKNQEIIQGFDRQMGNFALKFEIMEYNKELKTFCRRTDYEAFKDSAESQLHNHKGLIEQIMVMMRDKDQNDKNEMKQLVRQSIFAHHAKLSAETSQNTLDRETTDQLRYLAKNITSILQNKAEITEIDELNKAKTNKLDTEHLMRCVDVLYKQLENVCVLLSQIFKDSCETRKQSQYSTLKSQEYLLEQSCNLVDWIKRFDPKTSNSITMPPNLMGLHTFTDLMVDESKEQTAFFSTTKRMSNERYRNNKLWASQSISKYLPRLTNQNVSRKSSIEKTHFGQQIENEIDQNSVRKVSNSVLTAKNDLSLSLDGIQVSSVDLVSKIKQSSRNNILHTVSADTQTPLKYKFTPGYKETLQKVMVLRKQNKNDSGTALTLIGESTPT